MVGCHNGDFSQQWLKSKPRSHKFFAGRGKEEVKERLSVKVHGEIDWEERIRRDWTREINTWPQETGKLMQAGAWEPCKITLKHTWYCNHTHVSRDWWTEGTRAPKHCKKQADNPTRRYMASNAFHLKHILFLNSVFQPPWDGLLESRNKSQSCPLKSDSCSTKVEKLMATCLKAAASQFNSVLGPTMLYFQNLYIMIIYVIGLLYYILTVTATWRKTFRERATPHHRAENASFRA